MAGKITLTFALKAFHELLEHPPDSKKGVWFFALSTDVIDLIADKNPGKGFVLLLRLTTNDLNFGVTLGQTRLFVSNFIKAQKGEPTCLNPQKHSQDKTAMLF
jgi:hypothetical protein